MEFLQVIWFFLIIILLAGYSILDGFDLGAGILTPFLARSDNERRQVFNAIGPFWDGNEVWLLTGGGALFAAFPSVYATVFSGFYLALMLVLFALIFRAISLEFWAYDQSNRTYWVWAFVLGSFLPSLLYGVAVGNLMQGIPLDSQHNFTGDFFTLLRPFPLAAGLAGFSAVLLQGGAYISLKTGGEVRERARKATSLAGMAFLGFFILAVALGCFFVPEAASRPLAWVFAGVTLSAGGLAHFAHKKEREMQTFLMTSLVQVGLWAAVAAAMFPRLVIANNDPALSMTVFNSSSSQLSLTVMLIIAAVGMPIVIGYTWYVYRVFKGKVVLRQS